MQAAANCSDALDDLTVSKIHTTYDSFGFIPPHSQWTVLAAFCLTIREEVKLISLGTGTKCLPSSKLSTRGEVVHDSHAEVLARRSALRWFFEEIVRVVDSGESRWIVKDEGDGRFKLRDGVRLNLYVSTLPCKGVAFISAETHDISQAETRPCVIWLQHRIAKWHRSRIRQNRAFLYRHLGRGQLQEEGMIIRALESCAPNREEQTRPLHFACPAVTKLRAGTYSAYKAHLAPVSCGLSTCPKSLLAESLKKSIESSKKTVNARSTAV